MAAAELPGIYVLDVLDLARRWKVRPDALLAGTGLSEEGLRDPSARVPIATCTRVVERAHELTGEPALALYQGMQMKVSSHGFLGFAAMTASTIREALAFAERFAATRTQVIGVATVVEKDTAAIVFEERVDLGGLREFAILGLMIGVWQLGQTFTGRKLTGVAECGFAAPAYLTRVPFPIDMLRFERPAHRLVFAAELLDVPLVSADPVAVQLAQAQCERELAMLVDAGLPGRVRAALVIDGGAGFRSVEEVARLLHVSTRTLKRKLAALGTSYSAILDETRRQRALLLLADRGLPLAEIAGRLGYTELPNFTRAFRKWTGTTPAAYRRRAG